MDTVEIKSVELVVIDDRVVVYVVTADGVEREVISETFPGPIGHCAHAGGIASAKESGR